VEKGVKSFDEMLVDCNSGVLITELAGLHSGLNSISGDFSLSAEGYEVKDGKRGCAVTQITIAGNFFELLKNIEAIGSDLKFGTSGVGSPSILVKEIAVAGE
jgi:PmbA protein